MPPKLTSCSSALYSPSVCSLMITKSRLLCLVWNPGKLRTRTTLAKRSKLFLKITRNKRLHLMYRYCVSHHTRNSISLKPQVLKLPHAHVECLQNPTFREQRRGYNSFQTNSVALTRVYNTFKARTRDTLQFTVSTNFGIILT